MNRHLSDIAVLTCAQMAQGDALAGQIYADGTFALMQRAAYAVMDVVLARHADARAIAILCGPGNNGGDGWLLAHLLRLRGVQAAIYANARPRPGTDAARAAALCGQSAVALAAFDPGRHDLVIDALFGAGLSRPLEGSAAHAVVRLNDSSCTVIAVDVPSGVEGDTGQVHGIAVRATSTITFFRHKPAHLLQPAAALCGDVLVVDIGIPAVVLDTIAPDTFHNSPALWRAALPVTAATTHKYARGAVAVVSGGAYATGASRLSAIAAARAGAGAVTVLAPVDAMAIHAAHLTEIMLAGCDDAAALDAFISTGKTSALVIGPGNGVNDRTKALLMEALRPRAIASDVRPLKGVVVDADALTVLAQAPDARFAAIRQAGAPVVLTPHDGEFARLFPALVPLPKLARARAAASQSGAILLLKGPDTVIAAPDGRAVISTHGTTALATAGSGDVLAGIIAALLAQGTPAFEAACAGAWFHAKAGRMAADGAGAEAIAAAISIAMGVETGLTR